MLNILCGIQCRSDSTRLPGKYAEDIHGKSLIQRCYESVATTLPSVVLIPDGDDILKGHLRSLTIPFFEGSKDDVLGRYLAATKTYKAGCVVRITGDCPYVPLELLSHMLNLYRGLQADIVSNCFSRTYPDGWDIEILSGKALSWLSERAVAAEDREHVTAYAYRNLEEINKDKLVAVSVVSPYDLSEVKTSIDTPEDLERVRAKWVITR